MSVDTDAGALHHFGPLKSFTPNELRKIAWPHRQWVTTHLAERVHDIRQQNDAIYFNSGNGAARDAEVISGMKAAAGTLMASSTTCANAASVG